MVKRVGANRRMKKTQKRGGSDTKKSAVKRLFAGIKVMFIVAGVTGLGFMGARKALNSVEKIDFFKIKSITVSGNKQVDTAMVLSLAGIEKDISMIHLNVSAIRDRLQKNPWIAKASVRRKLPGRVVIAVDERKPIAFVNLGSICMVDAHGYLWPLKPYTYGNLPLISGVKDTLTKGKVHMLTPEGISRINVFLKEIKQIEKTIPLGISQIDFSKKSAVCIRLESSPIVVRLNGNNVAQSLKNLNGILRTVDGNADEMPLHINLCYNNIAFVK